ncbi:MAG: redox-regulated ATPase YchF [Candidatus Nomurabacteria bacterium]
MSLSIGIVGLPNVGKSTLFNALTKNSVPAENYPFCTIDPSVGIVEVNDDRLYALSKMSNTRKIVPAIVEFVDIAGLVKGASEGAGLGNKFLQHIRDTDAILEVVRIFEDEKQIHVENRIDPYLDIQIINMELILADLATVNKRLETIEKDVKKGDKVAVKFKGAMLKIKEYLEADKLANRLIAENKFDEEELKLVRDLHLITMKPILYALNKKSGAKNLDELNDVRYQELMKYFNDNNFSHCIIDAKVEDELKDFEGEEKNEMRREISNDVSDDGIKNLIHEGYKMLGLETYFTTGEVETRGWTIKAGSTAPVAAAAIHTDFQNKFIRAEVIACQDLLNCGGYKVAKEKGLLRIEGKEYIVKDGDVIEFRI